MAGSLRSVSSTCTVMTRSPSMRCHYERRFTGSWDEEVIPKPHTDKEIDHAATRFEQLADALDPAAAEFDDLEDLRAIAEAADKARDDEAWLRESVERARVGGRSWNHIAIALGVSRQAARQRFGRSQTPSAS